MICKKKKNKYIYVFLLSLILVCGLLQSSALSCNTYASNTTTVNDYLNSNNFYDVCAYFCRGFASFPDPYGGGTGFTVEAFADYLEEKGKSSILQEPVTVIEDENNASGGRGYELPQEARQEIINFVNETVIEAEPLTYTECYIRSYNYLDPTQFSQYGTYKSVQEIIKNSNGYSFMWVPNGFGTGNQNNMYICTIDQSKYSVNFIGSTNMGIFDNVTLEHNWSAVTNIWSGEGVTWYMCRLGTGGRIGSGSTPADAATDAGYNSNYNPAFQSIYNGTGPASNKCVVMTHLSKDELVYVFNTLNAYKNYNAGTPQPYYLLSDPNYIAPVSDPVTQTGLQSAGNFYNSIVNNVSPGQTPEQVQTILKETLQGKSNNSSSNDDSFNLGFLGTIGKVITAVTGAFTPVQDLVDNQVTEFVTDVFGWLPAEVVILWISGIIFAVLFGVLKIIRG